MSGNNCTITKHRGAIGSKVKALLYYFDNNDKTDMRLREWVFFIQYY